MRLHHVIVLAVLLGPAATRAQDAYKIEPLKEGPPAALAAPIKETLDSQGFRVTNGQGKAVADIWLRKSVPASGKPAGPQGVVLFPFLAEGELLGALRFPAEGHDYRDQPIGAGVYTVRYGLQPVNGDHLGVSPYRDFALLLPADKDKELSNLPQKRLEERSAEAAGTSHPAILMLLPAPEDTRSKTPAMVHDDAKDTWGAVLAVKLAVKGDSSAATLPLQLVVAGVAMN